MNLLLGIVAMTICVLGGMVVGQVLAQLGEPKKVVPGLLVIVCVVAAAGAAAYFVRPKPISTIDWAMAAIAFVVGVFLGVKQRQNAA